MHIDHAIMQISMDYLIQGIGILAGCGAIYGGIRADLKSMHERIKLNEQGVSDAHRRLDAHIERGHQCLP